MGRGILSTLKIKQKGFCPKKGLYPSWKIYRRDFVHLVKKCVCGGGGGGLNPWIYDTSSHDTKSTEPFRQKGFLSKCHFVEFCRMSTSS